MANELDVIVGLRVRSLRMSARFSQQRLAELLGLGVGRPMDATTITRLEQGKRPITITEAAALAAIFKVDVADLLRSDGHVGRQLELRMARQEVLALRKELDRAERRLGILED